jgi:hypothetical protein
LLHMKLRLLHMKLHMPRFKLRLPHMKLHLGRFKRASAQVSRQNRGDWCKKRLSTQRLISQLDSDIIFTVQNALFCPAAQGF